MKTEEHSLTIEHTEVKVNKMGFDGRLEITESIGQYKNKTNYECSLKRK